MPTSAQPRPGIDIYPQPGPQTTFLTSDADIAIMGGAAGGGKSYALLIESLRHPPTVPGFDAVIFRRTTVDIRKPGGLWSESMKVFPYAGGVPVTQPLEWRWQGNGTIKLAHLEHETTVLEWHGSQCALICFDELTTFTRHQFLYMLSRNRTMCGKRPYVRATCNADASSWVAALIAWWIDQDTGYAIPERSGIIRYLVRGADDGFSFYDTRAEAARASGQPADEIKSFTFVPAKLDDNPALTRADPGYRANLMLLDRVNRERLLSGNWKIMPSAGRYFSRAWIQVVDIAPACTKTVRGWDLAGSDDEPGADPDWTCCTKIGLMQDGRWIVLHHDWFRGTPQAVERRIWNYSRIDGAETIVGLAQDPGQAGKAQIAALTKLLAGYTVISSPESGDKVTRFSPFSAQCEAGNVMVMRGAWNERWFDELENFPEGMHDDDADSTSRSFMTIAEQQPMRIDPDELRKLGIRIPPDLGRR
jgi:predicted phage terminase large subunit-like protein